MKKLRFFDSLKIVRFVVAAIVCTLILNVAHAATTAIQSVIAYGKTEQSGTPTPTNPVPIMTNNGELKVSPNICTWNQSLTATGNGTQANLYSGLFTPSGYPFKQNTQYTISFDVVADNVTYSESGNLLFLFIEYTDGTTNYPGVTNYNYQDKRVVIKTAVGKTVSRIRTWNRTQRLTGGTITVSNMRIEEGSTATTGIYADGMVETIRDSAGHTATAQMLLGLNDTYRDEQNINTGAITRKVGVKVLDGSESWELYNWDAQNVRDVMRVTLSSIAPDAKNNLSTAEQLAVIKCTHLEQRGVSAFNGDVSGFAWATKWFDTTARVAIRVAGITTVAQFKSWLAEQYAAGTPVIVVYPLATETTENVTAQQMTTAPVRQTAGSILGMPIEVVLGDGTREWVRDMITIATTRYNEESFAPVKTDLSAAVNAVEYVVSNTMSQAQAIDQIATSKQTRPDESCPPFKKCLLVEDEDGTPHWYEIYDPINDFLRPILVAAGLSGNQGAPTQTTHTENGSMIYDTSNIFFNGSIVFQRKYINSTASAGDRPFGPTTLARCADNATRTTNVAYAGICYNTGGMFRTLTEGADDDSGEWAVVYNGGEGGASLGITPGVVYGVAKCTSVGRHTTEMTGDVADGSNYWWPKKLSLYSTTLASLISEYPNSNIETVFNTLPSEYGTDEKPGYPRDNFINCWCKMTAIGVPGAGDDFTEQAANGSIMSVSGGWIFGSVRAPATSCAYYCAYDCANYVRVYAAFRKNVLTVK